MSQNYAITLQLIYSNTITPILIHVKNGRFVLEISANSVKHFPWVKRNYLVENPVDIYFLFYFFQIIKTIFDLAHVYAIILYTNLLFYFLHWRLADPHCFVRHLAFFQSLPEVHWYQPFLHSRIVRYLLKTSTSRLSQRRTSLWNLPFSSQLFFIQFTRQKISIRMKKIPQCLGSKFYY